MVGVLSLLGDGGLAALDVITLPIMSSKSVGLFPYCV